MDNKENWYTRKLLRDQAEKAQYLETGWPASSIPQDNIVSSDKVKQRDGNLHTSNERHYDGMESALARCIS